MRTALLKALQHLAQKNPRLMVLTGDLGYGLFEEYEKAFPRQYLNVGIAEQNMMGVATGLALEGHTVFTYSIANFATLRCLEQLRNGPCYHDLNVNVIASGGGFTYGSLGMSHHATEDLAIMRALPNVTVAAPCDRWEFYEAMLALAEKKGVGYIRLEKKALELPEGAAPFILGKARRMREGSDFTIIACGTIVGEALKLADRLSQLGRECRVLSMHTIKPLDAEAVLSAACETRRIIVIEEHNRIGGLGSAVAEVCADARVVLDGFWRVALPDLYSSIVGDQQFLRSHYKIDAQAVLSLVSK